MNASVLVAANVIAKFENAVKVEVFQFKATTAAPRAVLQAASTSFPAAAISPLHLAKSFG